MWGLQGVDYTGLQGVEGDGYGVCHFERAGDEEWEW